jgi:hypothetical protein
VWPLNLTTGFAQLSGFLYLFLGDIIYGIHFYEGEQRRAAWVPNHADSIAALVENRTPDDPVLRASGGSVNGIFTLLLIYNS